MTPVTTFPLVDAILAGRDRNLDGVILIAAQHLLQTTHAMLRSLFRVGLDPRNVAVIGKCYSTHPGVVDAMRADGIYVDDCSDAYAPHESFDTQYTRHVERFFAESWARLTAGRTARVVLLDDGGSLLAVAGAMLDASADVIGIEQTSAGYAKIVGCALGFPVINIARSSAKLLYESPIIAARVTQTAFERTAGIDSSAAILITGAGAIGTALADVLRPLHDRVDVYDTRSGCMTPIDLPNAIGGYDVIIGATGATSVPASMHESPRRTLWSSPTAVCRAQSATTCWCCYADCTAETMSAGSSCTWRRGWSPSPSAGRSTTCGFASDTDTQTDQPPSTCGSRPW